MPRSRRSLGALLAVGGAGLLVLAPALPVAAAEWDPTNPTTLPLDATSVTVTGSCAPDMFDEVHITWGTLTAAPDAGGVTIDGPYDHEQLLDPEEAPSFSATIDLTQLAIAPEEGNHLILTLHCEDSLQGGEGSMDSAPGWVDIVYGETDGEEPEPEPEDPETPDDPGGDAEEPGLAETGLPDAAAVALAASAGALLLGSAAVVVARKRRSRGA